MISKINMNIKETLRSSKLVVDPSKIYQGNVVNQMKHFINIIPLVD